MASDSKAAQTQPKSNQTGFDDTASVSSFNSTTKLLKDKSSSLFKSATSKSASSRSKPAKKDESAKDPFESVMGVSFQSPQ